VKPAKYEEHAKPSRLERVRLNSLRCCVDLGYDRNPQLGSLWEFERSRHHADDFKRLVVEREMPADHPKIAAE
jgi:hypothetical protein